MGLSFSACLTPSSPVDPNDRPIPSTITPQAASSVDPPKPITPSVHHSVHSNATPAAVMLLLHSKNGAV